MNIDDSKAPNTCSTGKMRLHPFTGYSKRHLRRKLAVLQRKLAKKTGQPMKADD